MKVADKERLLLIMPIETYVMKITMFKLFNQYNMVSYKHKYSIATTKPFTTTDVHNRAHNKHYVYIYIYIYI